MQKTDRFFPTAAAICFTASVICGLCSLFFPGLLLFGCSVTFLVFHFSTAEEPEEKDTAPNKYTPGQHEEFIGEDFGHPSR